MNRQAFEAFISAPPFEMPIERFDDRCAWPGSYTELEVDLAWQAWQAATAATRERCAKVCDAIAHDWRGANSQSVQCANAIRKGE